MALVCALNQGWWVLGTVLGAVLGAQAQIGITGLDFVLAALFAVLAVEQWRARHDVVPIWIAMVSYGAAFLALPAQALAIAIGLSLLATLLRPARTTGVAHD